MKILKLQSKTEGRWEDRKELMLKAAETVSLITLRGKEIIESDIDRKRTGFCHGIFKANIVWDTPPEGNLPALKPGDRLAAEEVILTVAQAGKNCHSNCRIYTNKGCAFLKEILFLSVQNPGRLRVMEELNDQSANGSRELKDRAANR